MDKQLYRDKKLYTKKQTNRVLSPPTFDTVNVRLPDEHSEIPLPPSTPRKHIPYDPHQRVELMERQQTIKEQKI